MRIATYLHDGVQRAGLVADDLVHPFADGLDARAVVALGLDAALALGAETIARTSGVPLADVRLLAPLAPASVRDFVAFEEHVEGVRRSIDGTGGVPEAWYDAPTFYFTNPHTILGPGDDVPFPADSVARDFELEVAVVVGAGGRNLSVDEARDAVFGYTVLNDWSARDLQSREMKVNLGPAKGKDFSTTLGPWIVTADELEPYRDAEGFLDLACTASVNGEVVGRDLLSNMGWTFEAMIAYASRSSRVVAGDVLGSGTVGNGGCLAELWGRRGQQDPPPLRNGDEVTLTVEGIGTLTNRVASAEPAPRLPPVRRRDSAAARRDAAALREAGARTEAAARREAGAR
ncbi:fumarylacetoacetate hydrolase family protein [Cryptosporangium aurantiacum]|uniref:2-keto-4-pentenoate hydratase/2-oxohepta-3-ene-1,7-dioic acid hydratase (Catechol pathway) n=1 Tax=Cryptosporangium aurantiacum TaxID=134849 RepID=A0A1M7TTY0_9ACTN|nr:fumarylacetoacetate hydrolase family protein [Cryptosporangium aurantiacum]SHN74160.1 2-keto-4-pentenoate hydratase/2-oxohepta-3-ene-1,7-dioic acid hydratase (catechol pathway) [Cryptosporangium aurantiacum]